MDRKKQELIHQVKAYLRENDLDKMADFLNEMSYEDQYTWLINYTELFGNNGAPSKDQVNQVVKHIEDENFHSSGLASNIRLETLGNITLNPSSEFFKFLLGTDEEHLKSENSKKAKFYYKQAKAIVDSYNRKDVITAFVKSYLDSDKNESGKNSGGSKRGQHLKKAKINPEKNFWKEASTIYHERKEECVTKNNKVTNFLVDTLYRKKFVGYNSDETEKKIPLTKPTIRRRLNERLEKSGTIIDPNKNK